MADEKTQGKQRPPTEVHVRGVLWGAAAIACGIALAALASWLLWQHWGASAEVSESDRPNAAAGSQAPALQSAPQQDRAQYYTEKRKLLDSWEWIDRQRGIARIPVEEAMRIMAARGGKAAADARKESR